MTNRLTFEEEPFEGEFPFEEDLEVFGPDEDLESLFGFEGDLESLGFEAEEGELSAAKVRRAVRLNRRYGKRLGWDAQYDRIEPFLGFTNYSPDEQTFAQAVARWQGSQGLKVDGVIGPNTWRRMQAAMKRSRPAATPSARAPLSAAKVRRAVRLNRSYGKRLGWNAQYDRIEPFLGFTNYSPDEQTFAQAVARWQRSQGLKVDGVIGPDTWRPMQAAMKRKPAPVIPTRIAPAVSSFPAPVTPPHLLIGARPFPHIRQKRPNKFRKALKALIAYQEVKCFLPIYWKLNRAAHDARLTLDRQSNIVISPRTESFLKLLTAATANKIRDEIKSGVTNFVLGKRLAVRLGVLDSLLNLFEIRARIQRERLVKEQFGKLEEKAFKRKLSFFMDVMARDLAKQKPGRSHVKIKNWLVHQYQRFEPIFMNWKIYVSLEGSLDPRTPKHPTIGPAP